MAGGGMGAMPTGMAQQGSAPMGNPMSGAPGMAGGIGMGGGQPGIGFGQGPGYGVDNYGAPQGLGMNPGMPQGDTFQPQIGGQPINMQQISQMLRGIQQAPQQPMQTGSAERNWVSQSPYGQQPQTPVVPQQPMVQQPRRGFFGMPSQVAQAVSPAVQEAAKQVAQQQTSQQAPQQGIAALGRPRSTAMQGYMDMLSRRRR